jgi:hypothetical protein
MSGRFRSTTWSEEAQFRAYVPRRYRCGVLTLLSKPSTRLVLVALPNPAPFALAQPDEDAGIFELMEGSADRHVRLAGERLCNRDIDHRLRGQNA